ncbi:MAG: hypothetical protein K8R21_08815 [Leptospira sp.]|nr:hypothetical protein [Leptospira sp.]
MKIVSLSGAFEYTFTVLVILFPLSLLVFHLWILVKIMNPESRSKFIYLFDSDFLPMTLVLTCRMLLGCYGSHWSLAKVAPIEILPDQTWIIRGLFGRKKGLIPVSDNANFEIDFWTSARHSTGSSTSRIKIHHRENEFTTFWMNKVDRAIAKMIFIESRPNSFE